MVQQDETLAQLSDDDVILNQSRMCGKKNENGLKD